MSIKMRVDGFRDIERALAALPRGTATGVARRAMKKELKPVMDAANALWPGASDKPFRITSRIKGSQRGDSVARRGPSILNMYVGATEPHAHLIEFGTGPRYTKAGAFRGSVAPDPMLQPAWDANKRMILDGLGKRLWEEIQKTQARRAKRAAS